MIKYLSFDLQGTLSESSFSDYYWFEVIPKKYSEHFSIPVEEAKKIIKGKFKEYGVYNILYYDNSYWSNYLKFNTAEELAKSNIKPKLNEELYYFISKINLPKIIISTTTNLFIDLELGDKVSIFNKIYSCVDYFKVGGKTKEVYKKICEELKVEPSEILHIGDNKLMDINNAEEAGINTILFENNTEEVIEEIKRYLKLP